MKNLLIVLLCVFGTSVLAQTKTFFMGAEGGPGIVSLRGNKSVENNTKSTIGYTAGIFAQYNLSEKFSVRSGVSLENKGAAIDFDAETYDQEKVNVTGKEKFNYITVPVLLRVTFGKKINYFVNAGPFISFLTKQTEQMDAVDEIPSSETNYTDIYKKTDLGLAAGAGLSYTIREKVLLSFELRDNLGLSKINNDPQSGTIKTNAFNFLVGIGFRI